MQQQVYPLNPTIESPIRPEQRFRSMASACPICGGWDSRSLKNRCYGYLSIDKEVAFCTRSDQAGPLPESGLSGAFMHKLHGSCDCGRRHGSDSIPAPVLGGQYRHRNYRPMYHGGIVECYYNYFDWGTGNDKPLYRVVRYHSPKSFNQQRYEGGEWKYGLNGCKRVLYQLPQLVCAPDDATIYLPEGEKDVLAITRTGNAATTNAGGSGNWRSEFTSCLRDRIVVIIEDNDAAGRERTNYLIQELAPVVRLLKVGWFPNKPKGYDVSDWLAEGRTMAQMPTYITSVTRFYTRKDIGG